MPGGSRTAAVTEPARWGGEAGPRHPAPSQGVANEAAILDDIVEAVGAIHRLCRVIARHDPDLAKQMRRAVNSVGLNAGEGLCAAGANRTVRLASAMNSGREVVLGLRIAGAAGNPKAGDVARHIDSLDRVIATLYKLAYRAR